VSVDLLSATEAAEYLKVAKQTLAVWRLSGRGPAYMKIGRKIAYSKDTLNAYLAAHTFSSTAEYQA